MRHALKLGLTTALLAGCGEQAPPRAGGDTTVDDRSSRAFMQPAPNLTAEQEDLHRAGDAAFAAHFVPTPAPVNPGLGPLFNNDSCNNCHLRNGRGMAVMGHGPQGTQLLVRVSIPDGTPDHPLGHVPVPGLGTQIADHANYGVAPEADLALEWDETEARYPDGTAYRLRSPRVRITPRDGSALPARMRMSLRLPPPIVGLGLLEAVPESTLRQLADPDDRDRDGLSGRVNEVWDVEARAIAVGRFGWKANSPSLVQQSAEAYFNDMGITNPLFPEADGTTDIPRATLEDAVFYARSLGVPARAALDDLRVKRGEELFTAVGCQGCHRDTLETGAHPVAELSHQRIHPYTDLLLHDLGPGLADGRPDGRATGSEWRTAPLWGVGLTPTVTPYAGYLHDGRARTLEEAILWHGGEADPARERFRALSASDREAMLLFLGSL
ncbi:di-heme oxidoredictase family protein [Myxococcaceae bacterium GXIMD 01537]